MAYGEAMERLSPCGDELICGIIGKYCPADGALLDLGCGRGDRLAAAAAAFPGLRLRGIDSDGDMVGLARSRAPGADIRLADAACLPFEKEEFDIALCECSLSLFPEPEKSLSEARRVLKMGGRLVLAELFTPVREAEGLCYGGAVGTLRSRSGIEAMARSAGFSLIDWEDRSRDLAAMAAQMILDGSACACLGAESLGLLRRARAGYGLWIFGKDGR